MPTIVYTGWALIPVNDDPLTERPYAMNPPMMVAIALDPGASLVAQLKEAPSELTASVTTTALSAEGQPEEPFKVYTASATGNFRLLDVGAWDVSIAGADAVFSARLSGAAEFIKLVSQCAIPLVVNTIDFERE